MAGNAVNIWFATGNPDKCNEVHEMMQGDVNGKSAMVNVNRIKIPDIPELQGSYREIAEAKARYVQSLEKGNNGNNPQIQFPLVIEDTSLNCGVFNDVLPGPFIKFFEQLGNQGIYDMVAGYNTQVGKQDYSATARCTAVLIVSVDADPIIFVGDVKGTIVSPVPGPGFGWDNIFKPNDYTETFSQMTKVYKNQISHRSIAFGQIRDYLMNISSSN